MAAAFAAARVGGLPDQANASTVPELPRCAVMLRVVDRLPGRTVRLPSSSEVRVIMASGTIKKVIADRGFGFITGEDGKDYFFHRDTLQPSLDFDRLQGGERVTFEIQASPKGPRATQVAAAE
jgi:CspA family cold shock protein